MNATAELVFSIGTSLVLSALSYGSFLEKVKNHKKEIEELKTEIKALEITNNKIASIEAKLEMLLNYFINNKTKN